jgi:hypothetical protein
MGLENPISFFILIKLKTIKNNKIQGESSQLRKRHCNANQRVTFDLMKSKSRQLKAIQHNTRKIKASQLNSSQDILSLLI